MSAKEESAEDHRAESSSGGGIRPMRIGIGTIVIALPRAISSTFAAGVVALIS